MFKKEDKLKNCPFCDCVGSFVEGFNGAYESRNRIGYIACNNCGAQGEKFAGLDGKEKAIRAWNRRWMDYDAGYHKGLSVGFYEGIQDVMGTLAHQYNLTALEEGLITRVSIKIEKEPKE